LIESLDEGLGKKEPKNPGKKRSSAGSMILDRVEFRVIPSAGNYCGKSLRSSVMSA
jgi:hypothetical protein